MPREALRIQKIIQVTKPTARIDITPPIVSWAVNERGGQRGDELQQSPGGGSDGQGRADTDPDQFEAITMPGLDQEGGEDADDQRGLESFSESDQVVGEHGGTLS